MSVCSFASNPPGRRAEHEIRQDFYFFRIASTRPTRFESARSSSSVIRTPFRFDSARPSSRAIRTPSRFESARPSSRAIRTPFRFESARPSRTSYQHVHYLTETASFRLCRLSTVSAQYPNSIRTVSGQYPVQYPNGDPCIKLYIFVFQLKNEQFFVYFFAKTRNVVFVQGLPFGYCTGYCPDTVRILSGYCADTVESPQSRKLAVSVR